MKFQIYSPFPHPQVSWMPAMVGGPGGGQPFNPPGSPIQFAPGVQHFSPPAGQFVGPVSPQFSPGGQPYMGMAPFPQQQGAFTSPNGQQFMTPPFAQQFPQNQGMPFRGGVCSSGSQPTGSSSTRRGGSSDPPPEEESSSRCSRGSRSRDPPG